MIHSRAPSQFAVDIQGRTQAVKPKCAEKGGIISGQCCSEKWYFMINYFLMETNIFVTKDNHDMYTLLAMLLDSQSRPS
jgi:hypothetical protein